MSNAPASPDENANLSGLGRALMGTGEGGRPSGGPWIPPTAEELQKELPQYEITRMLGRGGMGAVYMGRQTALDRPVAVKILSGALEEADHGFTERFKNEARAMARLNHPGIVGVYDFGQTASGLLYIVMEYVDGTDVAKMIAKDGRLHTEHAMAITAHVCDALAYAHERGIIHRDIKPANIMVGYDGVVKVADFGLAKVNTSGATSGLTQSNVVMGTLHYMAPEALMLGNAVDHRADIYAVGVMLYQMLTGKIPQGMFELPSLQVKGLDPRYDGIIAKALREDRDKRYGRALELRHDLDTILTQPVVKVEASADKAPAALQTQARPQRPGGQPYRPPQKVIVRTEKKSSPLLWIAVVALAAVAAWLYWNRTVPESPPQTPSAATDKQSGPAVNESSAATTTNPAEATKDRPFVNSLGMKFVPVPGTQVLFCIHETRKADYETYAEKVPGVNESWKNQMKQGIPCGYEPDHPVVGVSWKDAVDFCAWLSTKEGKTYRLPTDEEWSAAVGLGDLEKHGKDTTPEMLSGKETTVLPWVGGFPPQTKEQAGNYADETWHGKFPGAPWIENYRDGYATTAPVMSFKANKFGLYDMGGNVWEFCGDWYNAAQKERVLRGGSFYDNQRGFILASSRAHPTPGGRLDRNGFRCVIDLANLPGQAAKTPVPLPASDQLFSTTSAPSLPPTTAKAPSPPVESGGPVDVLALIDPARDTFNGVWKRTADGLFLEGDGNMQVPYAPPQEYDFEVEFSISSDSVGVVAQQVRFEGKPITWIMSGQAPGFRPRFGFGPITGISPDGESEASVFATQRFSKGVRHRSTVRIRKDSLTGMLDGREMVIWKPDASRIPAMRIPTLKADRQLAFNAKDGNITFHKATITPFTGQVPPLPTGPTTWTDTKGRSITATFKAIASGNVLLDIAGKVTPVPLNTLSAESQKLARAYHDQSNPATTNDPAQATKDRPFVNSLGMKFVPVPGTKVLFSIWHTRVQDYEKFVRETQRSYKAPDYEQGPTHPVMNIQWDDAKAFCDWLSGKDGLRYRLPQDAEWSTAAGDTVYPWGNDDAVPKGFGNFHGAHRAESFAHTTPVGSFPSDKHGLFDMAGNAFQWCEDIYDPSLNEPFTLEKFPSLKKAKADDQSVWHVTRGSSWGFLGLFGLRTSFRQHSVGGTGFRCVIDIGSTFTPASSAAAPPAPTSPRTPATTWKPLRAGEYADSRDISIRGRFKSGQFAALTVRGSEAGEKPESKYWAALQTNGLEVVLFREWRNPSAGTSRFANSTLARTSLKQAIPKNKQYTLTFTAVGDQLKVLVDDIPVIEVVDKMLPGRFAGCLGDPSPASLEWAPAVAP